MKVPTDNVLDAVLRVDPVTGDRTVVSDAGTGAGPTFTSPVGIAVEASGDLVVLDFHGVLRVDPVTGDRTIVSGAGTGAGPTFSLLVAIAVDGVRKPDWMRAGRRRRMRAHERE